MNPWSRWVQLCVAINDFISKLFYNWAGIVGHHPKSVIATTLVISLGLISGFARFNLQTQSEKLYFSQSNEVTKLLDRSANTFPSKIKLESVILAMRNGSSIFNENVFNWALKLHEGILKTRLTEICIRVNSTDQSVAGCLTLEPLEIFDYNKSKLAQDEILSKITDRYKDHTKLMKNGRPLSINIDALFGNVVIEGSKGDVTIKSSSLHLMYFVSFSKDDSMYKVQQEVEKEFIDYLLSEKQNLASDGISLYLNAGRSVDDNIEESSKGDIKFVVVSIGAMCAFTAMVMIKVKDKVGGHFWVGTVGISCITLGIGASFGFVLLCGEYYVAFVGTLPFLVLGVGIDDMFIITGALDQVDKDIKGIKRLQVAMSEVGASVTMTTITDIVAFGVSASTAFPAVQYFCTYAAVSIVFVYVLIVSLLLAAISFDIKRIENKRMDLYPCLSMKDYNPWQNSRQALSNKIMHSYATFIMKLPIRILVTLVCFGLLGVGIWGALKVEEKTDLRQLGTEGSFFVEYLDFFESNFPTEHGINIILDDTIDYSSHYNQDSFRNLTNVCRKSKYMNPNKIINWMNDFLNSLQCVNRSTCVGENFMPSLHLFLKQNPMYYSDLKINADNSITASRMVCSEKNNPDWNWRKDSMVTLRNAFKTETSMRDVFPIHMDYFYREQIVAVKSETIRNLIISAFTVLVITTPFLVHPVIILLVFVGFVGLVVELFALMAAWNVPLNSISMIISIMSIGFAVDYSAHVAHHFILSNAPTPEERIVNALSEIGASVLMGGMSTFIGVFITAFGSSEIFRIFFCMLFGIVVIGLLNGLLFLPVLLSIFCRTKVPISARKSGSVVQSKSISCESKEEESNNVIENSCASFTNETTTTKL